MRTAQQHLLLLLLALMVNDRRSAHAKTRKPNERFVSRTVDRGDTEVA
jgi:hypothetical protein